MNHASIQPWHVFTLLVAFVSGLSTVLTLILRSAKKFRKSVPVVRACIKFASNDEDRNRAMAIEEWLYREAESSRPPVAREPVSEHQPGRRVRRQRSVSRLPPGRAHQFSPYRHGALDGGNRPSDILGRIVRNAVGHAGREAFRSVVERRQHGLRGRERI